MSDSSRRDFLKGAAGAGLTTLAAASFSHAADDPRPIPLGVIGTGGMGMNHVRMLAQRKDARIVAVCDVDQTRLQAAAEAVSSGSGTAPAAVADMRQLLANREIEAVFIATPDHWHSPAAILALDAGKHVYVEKPCSHNIREGRLLADAVARSGKLLQVGTQSRSTECVADAIQRIHNGEIGEVLTAKAWNSQRRGSIGHAEPSDPPATLDFDAWVGPAPMVRYQRNLLHGIWRWWYDFGCGDIGNDGVHDIDVALWGLGAKDHPTRVTCFGSKLYFDDDQQFPDTQYSICEYAPDEKGRKKQLIFEQRIWSPYVQEGYENGAAFYGTDGYVILGHSVGWRLYKKNELVAERKGGADLKAHHDNFLACVRGEAQTLNADVHVGHRAATIVHLSNIAARTGAVLEFDPVKERITNHEKAAAMVARAYRREHWAVPKGIS